MQAINIHNDVIGEVSEAEEQNQTTLDIGMQLHGKINEIGREGKELSQKLKQKQSRNNNSNMSVSTGKDVINEDLVRDRNRDSMFGTMLLTKIPVDLETRVRQIQDPHQVMKQRLNDINPLMFGDTIRLPMPYHLK